MKKKLCLIILFIVLFLVPLSRSAHADTVTTGVKKYCAVKARNASGGSNADDKYKRAYNSCIELVKNECEGKNIELCIPEEYRSSDKKEDTVDKAALIDAACKDAIKDLKASQQETGYYTCKSYLNNYECNNVDCYHQLLCNSQYKDQIASCNSKKNNNNNKIEDKKEDNKVITGPTNDNGSGDSGSGNSGTEDKPVAKEEPKKEDKIYDLCAGFEGVVYYAIYVIKILRTIVPILLIIWASVDLLRSIISSDEKMMKAKRKPIIQRVISAVLVFLLPWLVSLAVGSFSKTGDGDWKACWIKAWNKGEKDTGIFNIKNW